MISNHKCGCLNTIILEITTFNDADRGVKVYMCDRCSHVWEENYKEEEDD